MPTFHWTGRTVNGQEVSGKMEAPFKDEVVRALQAQNIAVHSVTEKNEAAMSTLADPSATPQSEQILGRIVFIVLMLLAICLCIGLIWKFIG